MNASTESKLVLDLAPHGQGFVTESELLEMLPHGSGIDCRWDIRPMRDGVECFNSYHLMNENGMYDGYADFSVQIFHHRKNEFNPLKGPSAGLFQVLHRKGDIDFRVICRGSAWRRNSAYDLKSALEENFYCALEKILTKRHETITAAQHAAEKGGKL